MLMKRLYRFVLKRLIGPFLVNNDIAIKDLDVKLRDRTVELRNLQLDIDVLNETLGLGEVRVASASIAGVILSGKDGFSVKVSGVRVVLHPRGGATRTKTSENEQHDMKLPKNLEDDDELDDLEKWKAASKPADGSSLSEGLSSVESWIERSINMLKVEISDVLVEIRLPETSSIASPYYLTIFVESCESQTNFDAAVRQTELFGVHISLKSTDSSDEIRLVYVEPSTTVDGKVCLIRAALDESFKERGYEISLFAVNVDLSPKSLASLLEFVSRFSACNMEEIAIRASSATPDGSDDEFFDALSSFAQSGVSKIAAYSEEPNKKQLLVSNNDNEQKIAPTIFRLELNTVSILASFGQDQSIRFECQGVVVTHAMFSINNLLCKIEGEDSDLMFDISKPPEENAVIFDIPNQKLSLFATIGMITSNKFKTLSQISGSYSNLSLTNKPADSSSSTLITPASSTSRWHFEAGTEMFVCVRGELDELVLRIFDVNLDAMGFSARDGSLHVQARQNNPAAESTEANPSDNIVMHLDKSITVTFVDNSSIATTVTSHEPSRVRRERDFEEDVTDDLGEVVTEFENACLKMANMVLDITVGMIRTPEELDAEQFQRLLAIIVTSGPSQSTELSESALVEPLKKIQGLPFFRVSCPHGRFSFAKAKSLPGCSLEFRDFSCLSYGSDSAVKIQHLSLAEKLEGHPDCAIAPILFSSRFASDTVSSAVAMIEMKTLSDLSVRVALCGYTFRYEPRSQGLLALSTFMVPDGRASTVTAGFRTDIRLMIDSWIVDVFPSQSPFASQKEIASGLPQARLLATVGKMQIATCETLANLWRYDIDVMDAHLYLAKRSARESDEHVYVVSRGPGLMIHEYAELNGFVRIGEMHSGQFFLRAEGIMWDMVEIEAVVPMLRLMTCVDTLTALNALLLRIGAEIPSYTATTDIGSGSSSPRSPHSPRSPILILQRSTSAMPTLDLVQNMHHTVPDSELPASALRSRAANAPDSSLNAKQLQARYKKEPYLLPHVIDDYYSIGSLPTETRRDRPENNGFEEDGKARLLGKPRSSSDDLLDDFDIISVSPTPPPIVEKSVDVGRGPSKLRNNTSAGKFSAGGSASSKLPPAVTSSSSSSINKAQAEGRQTSQRKRKTFLDDDDEDEGDVDNNNEDDGMMMRSVLFTAPPSSYSPKESSTFKPRSSFHEEDDDNDNDEVMMSGGEPPAVQLIELSEITSKAKHGSTEAMQLQQSIMGLVETTAEVEKDSNDMAENEANLYKTALLASSAALTREVSGTNAATGGFTAQSSAAYATAGEGMWYPGKLLVHQEDSEEEDLEEEEEGTARYFDEDGGHNVQVRAHHFPVPILAKPGSFLPPQPVLAARIEAGGDLKDTAIRGRLRIILRDCSFTWSLFGGHDFVKDELALFEPIYGIESTSKDVQIVENHFQAGQPLFGTDTTKPSFRTNSWAVGRRDVNRVVEIVAEKISLLLDSFGDGAAALSLAIHQFELIDAVKVSPVKKVFQHWENEKLHPRFTAEDMVRFTLDISAKNTYQMHAAFLPVRLMINQDTLDLLNSFSNGLKNPSPASSSSTIPSPIIDLADFRAVKLKIDYYPKRVDLTKVREGKYAELVHLFSYEGMEVALKRAQIRGSRGFDQMAASIAEYWAQDVLNKQLYQLLAGLSPTLKNVATDMADIVLLPADLFRGKASSATAGLKAQKFAKTIVIEGCGIGKKVASAALNLLDDTRMKKLPKGMPDGLNVAAQAMVSRAKHVHHTIVAVPLTVWQREGATGALKSVIRAIPIAVIQPVLGLGEAVEAISSGIQFHIDPDQYNEESRRWKHSTT